jgi:riboflavin synthase
MFGGIVETMGKITLLQRVNGYLELAILPEMNFSDLKIGDSVAVNGVCLTVTKIMGNQFYFIAVQETLRLTNLDILNVGSKVNLERALALNSRIGGHYVQGHIDFCGEIIDLNSDGKTLIRCPEAFGKYIINKGFITLDGMSITVIEAAEKYFSVTFIPHTQQHTIVSNYRVGQRINVEVDMIAKYIEKYVGAYIK